MPLTNAQKQSRHRERVAEKLKDLKRLRVVLTSSNAEAVDWLRRSAALSRAIQLPQQRDCYDVQRAAKSILELIDTEPDNFAAKVVAEMEQRLTKR